MTDSRATEVAADPRLRANNFDVLRLVFATMVVLFHIGILSQVSPLKWLTQYISATFAVQAFFVVSGFLVTMSYDRSTALRTYVSKRFWRIAPAYLVVVLGASLLLVAVSTLPASQYFSSAGWRRYVGANLVLSNFTAPSLPGVFQGNYDTSVNASLWTIKVEVAFYCLVPLMVWMVRRFGVLPAFLAIFLLSVAWKCGLVAASEHYSNDLMLRLSKQIPGQLAFFAGGALGYYRTKAGLRAPSFVLALLAAAAYLLCGGILLNIVAPIAVTVIVYWAAISLRHLPNPGKYGDFSYGLYLYHFPIVQVMVAAGWFAARPYATTCELLICASCLAVASWFFVERRFLTRRAAA